MHFEHNVKSPIEYINKTTVSFRITAVANINITSVTFFGVYSTYQIDEEIQDVILTCSNSTDTNTVNKNAQSVTFNLNYSLSAKSSAAFTMQRSGNGTFGLSSGVDSSANVTDDGAAGILPYVQNNIPHYAITYEIDGDPYLHKSGINNGYFYFNGLAVDYSDYIGNADWLIDTAGTINAGYPFIDGLATNYSDYEKEAGSKWYLNSVVLIPYMNGVKLNTLYNEHK